MTTITINEKTERGKQLIAFLRTVPEVKIIDSEKSPYNKDFVKKIKQAEKEKLEGKVHEIKIEDLWK